MNTLKLAGALLVFETLCLLGCAHSGTKEAVGARHPDQIQSDSGKTGVIDIQDPSRYTQIVAISDVHGMYEKTVALLQAGHLIDPKSHWIAGRTLLVVVGDSIDKGPESLPVIDLWIRLQKQAEAAGGELIHTLGNHEAEFLAYPDGSDAKVLDIINEIKASGTNLSELTDETTVRGKFIYSEPVALRVGSWFFCHAGYFPDMTWDEFVQKSRQVLKDKAYSDEFLIGDESILEKRKWELDPKLVDPLLKHLDDLHIFGVVFGHQPKAFGIKGRTAAKAGGRLIKIDNGMPPEGGDYPGSLLVFTQPLQMKGTKFPSLKVIDAEGVATDLLPE